MISAEATMSALPQPLYDDLTSALAGAGRRDLVRRLEAHRPRETLTSGQAAALLGVSSANTVKNWLEAGLFPGAFKTAGGHWRFDRDEVAAVKSRMDDLREKNRRGDLTPPDTGDEDSPPPPLL
jgi:excisionase family DNA binding protein